jgi:TonB family protein
MAKRMRRPFLKSIVIHLILVGVVVALLFASREPEKKDESITLENIRIEQEVKQAVHEAVHQLGIPHEEPEETVTEASAPPVSPPVPRGTPGNPGLNREDSGPPPGEMERYLAGVIARLHQTKRYPREAQFNEQEGTVMLLIEVAADGGVLRSEVENASPFESLNRAALEAVRAVGRLAPVPTGKAVILHIPIRFQLR